MGAPDSPLSMGPECPRYATVQSKWPNCDNTSSIKGAWVDFSEWSSNLFLNDNHFEYEHFKFQFNWPSHLDVQMAGPFGCAKQFY